jgi:hypothetical protein
VLISHLLEVGSISNGSDRIKNVKNPLYAVIMDVLARVNPNRVMEVYKNMGKIELNEDNRVFLMDMLKKFEIDKKLKQEGREEGREEKVELLIKQLRKKLNGLPKNYEDKIKTLSNDKIESIGVDIFDIEKVEDLRDIFSEFSLECMV